MLLNIGLLITISPWLLRNAVYFGSFQISSRGGLALYTRAITNQMDMYEYKAAFHFWGPAVYKRLVRNTWLDVSDREYERGGRAVRLNDSGSSSFSRDDAIAAKEGRPQEAVSFSYIARAQRTKAQRQVQQAGSRHRIHAGDMVLRDTALKMIMQHPFRHILATIPFVWRGMWCFYGGWLFSMFGFAAYCSFVFVCFYAVVRKQEDMIAFAIAPFFLLLFNALLTSNMARFNAPAIPFMIISLVFAGQLGMQQLKGRFKVRGKNNDG